MWQHQSEPLDIYITRLGKFVVFKKNLTLIFFCFSNGGGGILGLCERPATGSHHHDGCGACYAILESPSLRFASKVVECEARRKNKIGRKKKTRSASGGNFRRRRRRYDGKRNNNSASVW
jgi:hypothetical protein